MRTFAILCLQGGGRCFLRWKYQRGGLTRMGLTLVDFLEAGRLRLMAAIVFLWTCSLVLEFNLLSRYGQ